MPEIKINGSELYYIEHGSGEIPVVFIHGLLLSSKMWESFYLPSMPDKYRCYALDMRGHGESRHVSGCTIKNMAEDVYAFAQKLNLDKFVYIGVSMGGGVGIQLALRHPEVLSALISNSPVTGLAPSGAFMFKVFGSFMAKKRWLLRGMIKGLCIKKPPKESLEKALDDAVLVSGTSLKEFTADKEPITGLESLNTLTVPTLVIIGDQDKAVPPKQQVQLVDTIPNAKKIVYKGEGHMVTMEKQEEVLSNILGFLYSIL